MNLLVNEKPHFSRIGIIDDSVDDTRLRNIQLKRAGFSPYPIPGLFQTPEELVESFLEKVDMVVCDNRLQPSNYAPFFGADVVACLYDKKVPAVLITQFFDQDYDHSIRLRRRQIPAILSKDNANSGSIIEAASTCALELQGVFSAERRPHRTLIKIVNIQADEIGATVLSWSAKEVIRFPAALVPSDLRETLQVDQYLLATVNTGADRSTDFYFDGIERAPDAIPEDNLG